MKLRKPLLAMALILSNSIMGLGDSTNEQNRRLRLQTLRASPNTDVRLTLLERAYLDTAEILDKHDQCSQFYRGPHSRRILDELVIRLREHSSNDSRTGLRMAGFFDTYVITESGVRYRLFEVAEINTAGAFYKSKAFPAERFVPDVGSFRPNTREARVLILLHELAHLIKGEAGTWLIPDDGGNAKLSRQNTLTVESRCGAEIRALQNR
jgi:hypothetical protein